MNPRTALLLRTTRDEIARATAALSTADTLAGISVGGGDVPQDIQDKIAYALRVTDQLETLIGLTLRNQPSECGQGHEQPVDGCADCERVSLASEIGWFPDQGGSRSDTPLLRPTLKLVENDQ